MILDLSNESVLKYICYLIGILFVIYICNKMGSNVSTEGFSLNGLNSDKKKKGEDDEDEDAKDDEDEDEDDEGDDKKGGDNLSKDLDGLYKLLKTSLKHQKKDVVKHKDKYEKIINLYDELIGYEIIRATGKLDKIGEWHKNLEIKQVLEKAKEIIKSI